LKPGKGWKTQIKTMRRSDKEITDKNIIETILAKSEICRIGISDVETPYIVPLNYGFSDGSLYFHSSSRGRKIDLLRLNNHVFFEIEYASEILKGDSPCAWTTKYRSVMGSGKMEIIDDPQGIRNGLDIIMAHYGSIDNTYDEAYLQRIVILKLNIEKLTAKQSGEWGLK
jgi:hypothetical protein